MDEIARKLADALRIALEVSEIGEPDEDCDEAELAFRVDAREALALYDAAVAKC